MFRWTRSSPRCRTRPSSPRRSTCTMLLSPETSRTCKLIGDIRLDIGPGERKRTCAKFVKPGTKVGVEVGSAVGGIDVCNCRCVDRRGDPNRNPAANTNTNPTNSTPNFYAHLCAGLHEFRAGALSLAGAYVQPDITDQLTGPACFRGK